MNFKVGQEVVCVKTHSQGVVKEGEIYVVKDMKIDCCKELSLDVGVSSKKIDAHLTIGQICRCADCGRQKVHDGIWWLAHDLFKPLDELYNEELTEELTEIFSKQPFEI